MAITISGSGIISANIADGTIVNADINSSAAIDGSKLTGVSQTTSVVNTAGQNWAGVTYTDPDAVGASPTAKIYPDGTVVGSTANGKYTKYPNGDLECTHVATSTTGAVNAEVGWSFPMAPIGTQYHTTFYAPTGTNYTTDFLTGGHFIVNTSFMYFYVMQRNDDLVLSRSITWHATFKGRWKA